MPDKINKVLCELTIVKGEKRRRIRNVILQRCQRSTIESYAQLSTALCGFDAAEIYARVDSVR